MSGDLIVVTVKKTTSDVYMEPVTEKSAVGTHVNVALRCKIVDFLRLDFVENCDLKKQL
jgi:hypothetical protein